MAALWETPDPAAQQLLREAGSSFPESSAESPSQQLARYMQDYKRITAKHRSLLARKVKLQAKTEAIKQQFEDSVAKLAQISNQIEEAEVEIERTHALVKQKVRDPPQPKLTAISGQGPL